MFNNNSNEISNQLKSLLPKLLISAGQLLQSNLANNQPKSYSYSNHQPYQNRYSQPTSYSYNQPQPRMNYNHHQFNSPQYKPAMNYNNGQSGQYRPANNYQPYSNYNRRPKRKTINTNLILKAITGKVRVDPNALTKEILKRGGSFNLASMALITASQNSGQAMNQTTINNIVNSNLRYQSQKPKWVIERLLNPILLGKFRKKKTPFRNLISLGLNLLFITHNDQMLTANVLKVADQINFNNSIDIKQLTAICEKYNDPNFHQKHSHY